MLIVILVFIFVNIYLSQNKQPNSFTLAWSQVRIMGHFTSQIRKVLGPCRDQFWGCIVSHIREVLLSPSRDQFQGCVTSGIPEVSSPCRVCDPKLLGFNCCLMYACVWGFVYWSSVTFCHCGGVAFALVFSLPLILR